MTANPSLKTNPNVDDWITIGPDGAVTVRSGKVDIGQRISTAVAILAAEELDIDLDRITVAPRSTTVSPDEGITSGSNSVEQSGDAIRRAAATARRHLLTMAAAHFNATVDGLETAGGLIRDPASNNTITYGELMAGRRFGIPVDQDAALKAPDTYTRIGRPAEAVDMVDLVIGRAPFVHDMQRPGMLHARVARPPHLNARLKSVDDGEIERLAAENLALIRDGSFLAVAGTDEYAVIQAAARLADKAVWDLGGGLDETDVFRQLTANDATRLPVIDGIPREIPVPDHNPPAAARILTARFERPYQMHGSIGPSAALAEMDGAGNISLWTHSQGIYPLRGAIAEALDLDPGSITIHHGLGAGCYGHNGADDAAFEAVLIARGLPGQPVLLKWTRDDEHAWEPYASAMAVELSATLDETDKVVYWSADAYSDTHRGRPRAGPDRAGPARLLASRFRDKADAPWTPTPNMNNHGGLHRNLDPLYSFEERRLVKHLVRDLPLRTSAMRCLGAVANVFALESFMDELAAFAGVDAFSFRRDHLDDGRAIAVLEAATEAMDAWPKTEGHGRGLAVAQYKNGQTYAAVSMEVAVDDAAQVHLKRACITADAGEVVDADGLEAQLEGGFLQAASWALYEQVTYDRDGITSRDWETYPILGFDNVPDITFHIVDRPGVKSLGAGEAAGGPTVAAIANAIHDATGIRLRRMPFTPEAIRAAAMVDA